MKNHIVDFLWFWSISLSCAKTYYVRWKSDFVICLNIADKKKKKKKKHQGDTFLFLIFHPHIVFFCPLLAEIAAMFKV